MKILLLFFNVLIFVITSQAQYPNKVVFMIGVVKGDTTFCDMKKAPGQSITYLMTETNLTINSTMSKGLSILQLKKIMTTPPTKETYEFLDKGNLQKGRLLILEDKVNRLLVLKYNNGDEMSLITIL